METYLLDWANLLLRWAHVITAIAWIGSSFYFLFLVSSLVPPVADDLKEAGVGGELWAVHGGGFYNHGSNFHRHGGYEIRHSWGNNWVAPVIGATILGGVIYAANRPVYVLQQQPIESAPPQGAYYCSAYQQFYPNVPTCPVPWQIVPYR